MSEVKSNRAWRLECEELRSRLAEAEAERALIIQRAENAEAALVEAEKWHEAALEKRIENCVMELDRRASALQSVSDERDALRSRLADWHKVADDRSAEIVRLNARLAEADKLLDDAKVWVPAFAGDLMRRIYDYFARCKQMQTIRTDRENERE